MTTAHQLLLSHVSLHFQHTNMLCLSLPLQKVSGNGTEPFHWGFNSPSTSLCILQLVGEADTVPPWLVSDNKYVNKDCHFEVLLSLHFTKQNILCPTTAEGK